MRKPNKVFISYSREDEKWLDKLQTHLTALQRLRKISVWDNTRIRAGDIRSEAIENALAEAKIAVLLVSANYLASDDILKQQLLPLLKAAEQEGLRIIWIYLSACFVDETEISKYQPAHEISHPLEKLSDADANTVLFDICKKIKVQADYLKQLRECLEQKKWKEADEETTRLMLEAAKKEQIGRLTEKDITKLDCDFLQEIDNLWVKHSNGYFGFSIQKEIWDNIYNSFNKDYIKAKERFGIHTVPWCERYSNGLECKRNQLRPSQAFNNKIKGYLPAPPPMTRDRNAIQVRAIALIAKRLERCHKDRGISS